MYVILIIAVIGALIGAGEVYGDWIDAVIGSIFGFIVGVVIGSLFALLTGLMYDDAEYRPVSTTPLVSLADGSGQHGSFFLGSGTVSDRLVYTWYEKNGNNSFVRKSADADSATIHYIDDPKLKPYYRLNKEYYTNKATIQKWGINTSHGETGYSSYDFYVPRGSITESYTLDNK